jgi:hypothetical protein
MVEMVFLKTIKNHLLKNHVVRALLHSALLSCFDELEPGKHHCLGGVQRCSTKYTATLRNDMSSDRQHLGVHTVVENIPFQKHAAKAFVVVHVSL